MDLKFRMALALLLPLTGCRSQAPATRSETSPQYRPAAIACISEQDPSCIGSATAGFQMPLPAKPLPPAPASIKPGRKISGRCEMLVEGEIKPRTCEGLRMTVRSVRENETKAVNFTGFGFQVDELSQDDYRVEASSDRYEVQTATETIQPSEKVKIRVRAKPRL